VNRRSKKLDISLYDTIFLFILALIPRFTFLISKMLLPEGLPQAYDAKEFINQAHLLMDKGIIDIDFNGIFYVGFYSILGLILKIINSTDAFVVFQMLINALTVILVYKLGVEILHRRAAIISSLLYAFLLPLIHWSIFITSDSLFISLMVLQAYLAVRCIKYNRTSCWVKLLLISIYMVFFRPTGIITLAFTMIYLLINIDVKGFIIRHKKIVVIAAGIMVVFLTIAIEKIINNPLTGSIERNMYWLLTEIYSNGQMYDIKTPYDLKFDAKIPPGEDYIFAFTYFKDNFLSIMSLYLRRIVAFAGVWIWKLNEMPLIRGISYLTFYGVTFLLMIIGVIDMFKKDLMKRGSIVLFMIGSIMIFTTFFFMDSAYRYRVPALVFGIYLLAQGISAVTECIRVKPFSKIRFGR